MDEKEKAYFQIFRIHYAFAWTYTLFSATALAVGIFLMITWISNPAGHSDDTPTSAIICLFGGAFFAFIARASARAEEKTLEAYFEQKQDDPASLDSK